MALHLVAVISWMAGILYLLRLFVYFAEEAHPEVKLRLDTMADRLYRIITFPAMVAALAFGSILLSLQPLLLQFGWMHGKLLLVAGMIGVTLWAGRVRRQLKNGLPFSSRTLRIINEVPTLLMIGIVFLVILKL